MLIKRKHYYPRRLQVSPLGDGRVIENLKQCFAPDQSFVYAEFGFYHGATAQRVLESFPNAEVHLFDFEKNVEQARIRLTSYKDRVTFYSNTQAYLDSYNWSLMQLMKLGKREYFDYVFLDGAHVWAVDALTFFLCDKLLKPTGYMEFDDEDWTIRGSSLDPRKNRFTLKFYTNEQIDSKQVALILDLLVRDSNAYEELSENRLFRKR